MPNDPTKINEVCVRVGHAYQQVTDWHLLAPDL